MAAQDYPWTSTKRGACQLFEFVSNFGLKQFLEKRKLRKGGKHLIDVFTPALIELLQGLLAFHPSSRLCLGESCETQKITTGQARNSVWSLRWLDGAMAV